MSTLPRYLPCALLCMLGSLIGQPLSAQTDAPSAPLDAGARSASPAPTTAASDAAPDASAGAPAAPSTPAAGCFPACRDGYVCHVDRCISACNPPCARDEQCTAAGQCEPFAVPPPPPPPPSTAPEPPAQPEPDSGYRRHDGFFLRLAAGLGVGGLHSNGSSDWGAAGYFSFDIGGSPIDNFALHFRMSHYGFSLDESSRVWDYASVGTWGVGATWYFMPSNLYLTASLGFASLTVVEFDQDDVFTDSDGGFGCGIDIGKEWWVGGSWGLGVAGRLHYVVVDTYSSTGFGVLFSASYQ